MIAGLLVVVDGLRFVGWTACRPRVQTKLASQRFMLWLDAWTAEPSTPR